MILRVKLTVVIAEYFHLKGSGQGGDLLSNAAQSNNADDLLLQFCAHIIDDIIAFFQSAIQDDNIFKPA